MTLSSAEHPWLQRAWTAVVTPIVQTHWHDWRDFWLRYVFDDRYLVCYFFPLLLILLLWPVRRLRSGIVLTGLAFLAYVFGAAYPLFWLACCVAFFCLGERFAGEIAKPNGPSRGTVAWTIVLVSGWYIGSRLLAYISLPGPVNVWVYEHTPWLLPIGLRGASWEPFFAGQVPDIARDYPANLPVLRVIFRDAHLIGTAYFAVRMLVYFSEIRRGHIAPERRNLGNFLAWLCYAPNLMQGPIERYNEFQAEMDTCGQRRGWQNVAPAFARIAWGIFKNLIVIWYFTPFLWDHLLKGGVYFKHPERIESYAVLYFGVYAIIFALYLEFSGYCDISAGMARLLGYRQVENFNWPWLSTSLREFWRRWHISLSFILRDYVYIPFGGNRRHATFNLCMTFMLCGLWHVTTPAMAIWGIVMGLMIAVNQWWVEWMKRVDASPTGLLSAIRRASGHIRPLPQILAWAITMHCFCMSLLIFFGSSGAIRVPRELIVRPLRALAAAIGLS